MAGADPGDLPAAPPGNFAAPGGGAAGDALGSHQPPSAGTALRPVLGDAHSDLRHCALRADGSRRLCGRFSSVCAPRMVCPRLCLGSHRLSGRRILDDPAADPSLRKTGGVRHPSAGAGGIVRRTDSDGDSINAPVYRCFWSGRTYRLEIGVGKRPYRPGETVTLYRDQRNGSVVEAPKRYRSTRQTL